MINFLNVVLHGYANERKYFLDYLLREQKKAEAEHYQAEEFFSKCFDVVEGFKKDLDRLIFEEKKQIFEALSYFKKEKDKYQKEIKNCNTQIEELSRDKFTVNLFSYTNTVFTGHLHYDHVLEIETKISKANEAYNSEINLEEVLKKYKRTPEVNLIPPYRLLFYKFDNWEKFLRFLKASTPRYFYVLGNLPPEDQIRLKNDFCDYLKEIREAQTESKYQDYLDNYISLIEEKYQETKKEVPLYNPEGKRQQYKETKKVEVIFPFVPPEWKFNDWKKFLWFFEVTRPTYIYIFDRLNEHEQFQLKADFTDYINTIIEKQTATKYIKALEGFKEHITRYKKPSHKQELESEKNDILTNPFENIFLNGVGYSIFNRLHKVYREKSKNYLANYSFLYESLKADKFLICDPKDWITFLAENYDITIEKIDARQSGKSKKTTAYEVIKEYYQEKAQ